MTLTKKGKVYINSLSKSSLCIIQENNDNALCYPLSSFQLIFKISQKYISGMFWWYIIVYSVLISLKIITDNDQINDCWLSSYTLFREDIMFWIILKYKIYKMLTKKHLLLGKNHQVIFLILPSHTISFFKEIQNIIFTCKRKYSKMKIELW